MKSIVLPILCCSAVLSIPAQTLPPSSAPPTAPVPSQYTVAERGLNHRVWQKITLQTNSLGQVHQRRQSYTELATGMHWRNAAGEWQETREQIGLLPGGFGAAATNGPHKLYLPASLYNGVLEVVAPDGVRQRSRPWGISYSDGTNCVLIAELKESVGQVLPSGSQVIYPDTFAGFKVHADVIVSYQKSGIEVDLVFRARPPSPGDYDMPDTSRLQLLTEFFDTPEPASKVVGTDPATGLTDTQLTFGGLTMKRGKAFLTGDQTVPGTGPLPGQRAAASPPRVPVFKSWQKLRDPQTQSLRTFLIEEVPYARLEPQLDQLAAVANPPKWLAQAPVPRHHGSLLSLLGAPRPATASTNEIRLARADLDRQPGVLLDYAETLSGSVSTNFTFRGDTTYFVSGPLYFSSSVYFDAGSVIKFPESHLITIITIEGSAYWLGSDFRPTIFTSKNDDSVGAVIAGSTGEPNTGDRTLLVQAADSGLVRNVRFSYADSALSVEAALDVWDAQFVSCNYAIGCGHDIFLHNVLFAGCNIPIGSDEFITVRGEHITMDGGTMFASFEYWHGQYTGNYYLTNSLFTGLNENPSPALGALCHVYCPDENEDVYQTAGAADYYLADNSPYRNLGTTNITPDLLDDLRQKTTYPPIVMVWSNALFSADTTLWPQAQRDRDALDIGFHYAPIDYLGSCCVSNATLSLTNGVVFAYFDYVGVWLHNGGRLASCGTPVQRNYLVHCNLVQEQPINLAAPSSFGTAMPINTSHTDPARGPSIALRFTTLVAPTGATFSLYTSQGDYETSAVDVQDCEIYAAGAQWYQYEDPATSITTLRNNLFQYADVYVISAGGVEGHNNLFACPNYPVWLVSENESAITNTDNAFDNCSVLLDGTASHNAYLNGATLDYLTPGPSDIFTNLAWVAGPLGGYYQPTNSPLIEVGSVTADLVGLYHYTVTTKMEDNHQIKETNSVVDCGFHYVAVDANGNPADYDGDGVPDYLEDANGNGTVDSGETDWQSPTDLGLKVLITRPRRESVLP